MARTKHHRNQRSNKCGVDFGARYKCDKGYHSSTGSIPKDIADTERRQEGKAIIRREVENTVEIPKGA